MLSGTVVAPQGSVPEASCRLVNGTRRRRPLHMSGVGGNVSFGSELPSQTEQRPRSALRAGRGVAAETGVSPEIILETVRMVLRGRELREVPDHGIDITFDDGVLAICRVCRMSWRVGRRQFTTAAWWSCPRGCSRTH